jgi:hypothetical protein
VPDLPNPSELPHRSELAAPPGWYPDPTGRAWKLYWDGRTWRNAIPVAPKAGPKNGAGIASLIIAVVAQLSTLLLVPWSISAEILVAIVAVFSIFGAIAAVLGGIILGIVAVVIGFVARGRVKRGEANNGGIAIAGIVLGFLAIISAIVLIPKWNNYFNQEDVDGCPRWGVIMGECS